MPGTDRHADNPLFAHDDLPRFAEMVAEQVVPAVGALVEAQERAREALEAGHQPTWEGLARPRAELAEPLGYAWGVVQHLLAVKNGPALREAEEAVQPAVVRASLQLGQSRALYDGFRQMRAGTGWAALSPAQQRIV
jgi:oligopeptidase A